LILIDKWATWCGPCIRSIPHLNKLHDKYASKGLVVIGVTREPAEKVEPFVKAKGMKYVVAIAEAREYATRSIPHAWLVSPTGKVVWKGHPSRLKEDLIQQHLKYARTKPTFSLPKALSKAEKYLKAEKYAYGVRALIKYINKPADEAIKLEAEKAVAAVLAYGKEQLERAEAAVKEKDFAEALEKFSALEKSFKGLDAGATAKKRSYELKRSKAVKLELAAVSYLKKAEAYIKQEKYKTAAKYLQALVGNEKYKDTKAAVTASERLESIRSHL
jgi:thiol-disulfide isomerase/thioredoxin